MADYLSSNVNKVTTNVLQRMRNEGEKIAMLTAYDYSTAKLLDLAKIDIILVGDSAANVMAGYKTTLPITLDNMIYHASSVVRAVERAFVVVDMPFGTYQGNSKEALHSAIRIMKESGADAVKLEGGEEILPAIRHMIQAGVPVQGHLGLTPQSVNQFGGYGLRAKEDAEAEKLIHDAVLLAEAGCFSIVLEKIPAALAARVTEAVKPYNCATIGIGAGPHTSGQVLVLHDMLGLNEGFKPKFLRHFAELAGKVKTAVGNYISAVKENTFPAENESY